MTFHGGSIISLPWNLKSHLNGITGKPAMWGVECKDHMVSVDGYMNMYIANTAVYMNGALSAHVGEVSIRCNNGLYTVYGV
ncbi:hypothetical protein FKM82_004892 [Ascaphus truei]